MKNLTYRSETSIGIGLAQVPFPSVAPSLGRLDQQEHICIWKGTKNVENAKLGYDNLPMIIGPPRCSPFLHDLPVNEASFKQCSTRMLERLCSMFWSWLTSPMRLAAEAMILFFSTILLRSSSKIRKFNVHGSKVSMVVIHVNWKNALRL